MISVSLLSQLENFGITKNFKFICEKSKFKKFNEEKKVLCF